MTYSKNRPSLDDPLLTIPETAAFLKISTRTAYTLAHRRDFPAFQISPNRIAVSRRGLEEWIQAQLDSKKEDTR